MSEASGAHTGPDTIRWFWAYDQDGNRITEAEPVGVRFCAKCGGAHPVADFTIASPNLPPALRPRGTGPRPVVVLRSISIDPPRAPIQLAHSEFPPD